MLNVYRSVDGQIFENEFACEEHENKLYTEWYEAAKSSDRGTHSKYGVTTRLCDVIEHIEKKEMHHLTQALEYVLRGYFTDTYGEKPLTEEALDKVEEIEKLPDPVQILRNLDDATSGLDNMVPHLGYEGVSKYRSAIEDMKKLFSYLEKSDK